MWRDDGQARARMPGLKVPSVESLSPALRPELGLHHASAGVVLAFGGLANQMMAVLAENPTL
ncbi:MAG: hypothetical protein WAW88_14450 [Nocardioides sp.]